MKPTFLKIMAAILVLVMLPGMLTACSGDPADTELPPQNPAPIPTVVTIEADGRSFTFEDATGMQVQQLLKQAGITLDQGDTLSFAPDQAFPGNITLQVLRQHTVTVLVAGQEPAHAVRHSAVLMEGTVADAISAVGVELAENHTVNYELNTALEDGMEIIVSGATVPEDPVVLPPAQTTDPTDPIDSTEPTEPIAPQTGKTIVSIDVYEDCDGSGHGIKIITYSDGTQEEVLF